MRPDPPVQVHVGALEGRRWAGLILAPVPPAGRAHAPGTHGGGDAPAAPGMGIRLRFRRADGVTWDWEDWYWSVRHVGPHAPDGSYARVAFDLSRAPGRDVRPERPTLVLAWSRFETGVVLRARVSTAGTLDVLGDAPWDWPFAWSRDGMVWRATIAEQPLVAAFSSNATSPSTGTAEPDGSSDEPFVSVSIAVDEGREAELVLAVSWGDDPDTAAASLVATAGERIERSREAWDTARPRATGRWDDLVDRIADNVLWMMLLQPETGRLYAPAGRRWIFPRCDGRASAGALDDWTVFGWDSFFNALELAVAAPALARAAVRAGLRSAYPDGNVPNWRGRYGGTPDRSQPPIASFALLKLHLTHPDEAFLAECYPILLAWSRWWTGRAGDVPRRRGRTAGLLAWGSDTSRLQGTVPPWEAGADGHQRAAWESGQDDLPLWDEATWREDRQALDMSAVDLCSYRALDLECLARIAELVGDAPTAGALRAERQALIETMNRVLWREPAGMYLDELPGGHSARLAASSFLPLTAGVPDQARAARMVRTLLDPGRFWGDFVIPTVARDDPAFEQQQYWRGSIWPPMNYLVLQGLRRYGFREAASALAWKGASMFLSDCRRTGMCRENFDARTGEGRGRRFQSWGPLFALGAVEELVEASPWTGLTVGHGPSDGPAPATGVAGLHVGGSRWDVEPDPGGYRFRVNGSPWVSVDPATRLRSARVGPDALTATPEASTTVTVGAQRVNAPAGEAVTIPLAPVR